ncbi:MAG: hypothetical protein HYT93_00075 [Parcubacteria group bacterium]|nr:hypothetical protein [Parcubacteria group bacterium]
MKKYIEYSVAVIALIIMALLIPSKYESHPSVVVITDSKFIPQNTYVQTGETITFINKGTRKHWPASDEHVTHSNYPQTSPRDCLGSLFDACRGLNPNEQWSFIYAFEGAWSYHDHLFPEMVGTVYVEAEEDRHTRLVDFKNKLAFSSPFDSKKINDILVYLNKGKFASLYSYEQKNHIIRLSNKFPSIALKYLTFVGFENGKQIVDTHSLAHIIGNSLFKKYGIGSLNYCTHEFTYGCQHGVITGFLLEHKNDIVTVENECVKMFSETIGNLSFSAIACLQGIAHPLLIETDFNIKNTLLLCDGLSVGNRQYCYDGVFIEYAFFAKQDQLDKNNIWRTCATLPKEHRERCAYFQPSLTRQILEMDFSQTKALCTSAPGADLKTGCVQGIGALIAHSAQTKAEMKELCNFVGNPILTDKCTTTAYQEMWFQNVN